MESSGRCEVPRAGDAAHFPKVERQQAEHALASTTGDVVTPPTIAPRPCIAPSPVIVTTVSGRPTSCTPQAPCQPSPM